MVAQDQHCFLTFFHYKVVPYSAKRKKKKKTSLLSIISTVNIENPSTELFVLQRQMTNIFSSNERLDKLYELNVFSLMFMTLQLATGGINTTYEQMELCTQLCT